MPGRPSTPPQQTYRAQGIVHAIKVDTRGPGNVRDLTAATQCTGDRTRPNGGHTKPWDRPCPHGKDTNQWGPATPPQQPHGAQGTGHAPTAATQGPKDQPRLHGGHTKPRGLATPHCGRTLPRGLATPPRHPHGFQGVGHAPTAATRNPGGRPRLLVGHTSPRRPATPPWQPYGAQDTGNGPTESIQHPGKRPQPQGGHTGPSRPDTPTGRPHGT